MLPCTIGCPMYNRLWIDFKKIHKAIKFQQPPWLKTYIDLNTMYRKKAGNTYEKDFFKLLNNENEKFVHIDKMGIR